MRFVGAVDDARALIRRQGRNSGRSVEVCEGNHAVIGRWVGGGINWLRGCGHDGTCARYSSSLTLQQPLMGTKAIFADASHSAFGRAGRSCLNGDSCPSPVA